MAISNLRKSPRAVGALLHSSWYGFSNTNPRDWGHIPQAYAICHILLSMEMNLTEEELLSDPGNVNTDPEWTLKRKLEVRMR